MHLTWMKKVLGVLQGKINGCVSLLMQLTANSSGESGCMLTPGFVSDQDDAVEGVVLDTEMQSLAELLPLTARRIRNARSSRR